MSKEILFTKKELTGNCFAQILKGTDSKEYVFSCDGPTITAVTDNFKFTTENSKLQISLEKVVAEQERFGEGESRGISLNIAKTWFGESSTPDSPVVWTQSAHLPKSKIEMPTAPDLTPEQVALNFKQNKQEELRLGAEYPDAANGWRTFCKKPLDEQIRFLGGYRTDFNYADRTDQFLLQTPLRLRQLRYSNALTTLHLDHAYAKEAAKANSLLGTGDKDYIKLEINNIGQGKYPAAISDMHGTTLGPMGKEEAEKIGKESKWMHHTEELTQRPIQRNTRQDAAITR